MLLVRVGVLIVAIGIVCGAVQKNAHRCQFQCKETNPVALCAFNGKCKFKFNSRCDLDYYNCQYANFYNHGFYVLWGDICKDSKYTTCPSFYDTAKHTYLPLPTK